MGYGYLLLDAIDPVDEVGDLAGDSVLRRRGGRCACYNVKPRRASGLMACCSPESGWPKTQRDT